MTIATTSTTSTIPGYTAGTWAIDPSHSDVSFTVRHLMVSKVRGSFRTFSGTIVTGEDPLESSVEAEIDLSSIDTQDEKRDAHLRSPDFFDTDRHPNMTFRSTGLRAKGDGYVLAGDLSLKGVTRPVELALELNGFGGDPWGGTRVGFTASGQISRKDFGVDFEIPMDGGGVVVGDKVNINLEIEAVLQQDAAA